MFNRNWLAPDVLLRVDSNAAGMKLVIDGQKIKNTAEHPSQLPAQDRFIPGVELHVGDLLVSSQETLIPIESISNLNESTTDYNFRVAKRNRCCGC
jgi:hypothetical protein